MWSQATLVPAVLLMCTVVHIDAQTPVLELTGDGTGGAIIDGQVMTMNCKHTVANPATVKWQIETDPATSWVLIATFTIGGACSVEADYQARVDGDCDANAATDGHEASFNQVNFVDENKKDFRCVVTDDTPTDHNSDPQEADIQVPLTNTNIELVSGTAARTYICRTKDPIKPKVDTFEWELDSTDKTASGADDCDHSADDANYCTSESTLTLTEEEALGKRTLKCTVTQGGTGIQDGNGEVTQTYIGLGLTIAGGNTEVEEGSGITLECTSDYTTFTTTPEVVWKKGTDTIATSEEGESCVKDGTNGGRVDDCKHHNDTVHILTIAAAQEGDAGTYKCNIEGTDSNDLAITINVSDSAVQVTLYLGMLALTLLLTLSQL